MIKNIGIAIVIALFMLGCNAQDTALDIIDNQINLEKTVVSAPVDARAVLDSNGDQIKLILTTQGGARVNTPVWLSSVSYYLSVPLRCEDENYKTFNMSNVFEPLGDAAYWSSRDFQIEADEDQFACGKAYTCYLIEPYYELVPGVGVNLYGQCDVI